MQRPAFIPHSPLARFPGRSRLTLQPRRSSLRPPVQCVPQQPRRRASVQMLGPFFPDLSSSNLMKSEIVRKEKDELERDYAELATLGQQYEKFDREGKLIFIEKAFDVVDRFAIFLARLKLSEEFAAQMFVKQYQLKLQEYGLTIETLIENTKKSLEMMQTEIKQQSS